VTYIPFRRHYQYYKNDFARHYPNINGGGHKIQPSRKMPEDFWRWTFSFTEAVTLNHLANAFMKLDILLTNKVRIARLIKSIYGDGRKINVSKNWFMERPAAESGLQFRRWTS
jgi:hypothetical protein